MFLSYILIKRITIYGSSQVIDFECTCEADLYDYNHEIIEFPAILIDVRKKEIVSKMDYYVYLLISKGFLGRLLLIPNCYYKILSQKHPYRTILNSFDLI